VSKSKFTSETGDKLDMDDPLFWQKVMPDFVTPSIMVQKLDELTTLILGSSPVKKGPGRGRWREKREQEAAAAAAAAVAAKEAEESKALGDEPATAGNPEANNMAESSDAVTEPNGDVKMEEAAEPKSDDEGAKEENDDEEDAADSKEEEGEDDDDEEEEDKEADGDDDDEEEEDKEADGDDDDEGGEDKEADGDDDDDDDEKEDEEEKEKKKQLTRTNQRKVAKFISDLKSMMENVLEEAEEESLPSIEKATCQKLLLTVSINEKLFNEQQRHYARSMLKKLEGDRRRRCRTSDQPRFNPGQDHREDAYENVIPEELRIVGTKKVKRKRRTKAEMEADRQRQRDEAGGYIGEDGYLHHSDSEGDWSDVGEEFLGRNKNLISRKEARRRRAWAADDDAATAAGRPWPVFPRHSVSKVLTTVLEEVMKYDDSKGGVFSVPVPRDDFPEYYEQIKKPMDYGTMKEKLENGEYRSAQAMQKDFILVMQNCLTFNSPKSDIVKDARQQALMRPDILRKAAEKHDLFLSEDGSVLEVVDDDKIGKKRRRSHGDSPKKVRLVLASVRP